MLKGSSVVTLKYNKIIIFEESNVPVFILLTCAQTKAQVTWYYTVKKCKYSTGILKEYSVNHKVM